MSLKTFQRNSIRLHQAFQPVLFALGLLLLFGSGGLDAREVPSTLTFQATLSQDDGTTFSCQQPNCITFRLFETETDGTAIWEEQQGPFNVRNGAFSVRLGRNEPLSELPFDTIYFLELQVADSVLSPRLELSTVPYSITSTRVTPGSIRRESIAEGAVDRDRIAPGAVDRERIQPGAVNRERLAERAVGRDQLDDRAVGRQNLEDRAVGRQNLEDRAVGREQIADRAVGRQQISADADAEAGSVLAFDGEEVRWMPPGPPGPGSVDTDALRNDAVTRDKIAQGAVDRERLAPGAVSQDRLASQAVGRQQMEERAVGRQQLDDLAVGRQQLEPGAVGRQQIDAGAVGREQIGADPNAEPGSVLAFDGQEVLWMPPGAPAPGSVTEQSIAAGAVTREKIALQAIDRDRLAPGAVGPQQIELGAVGADQIAAGAVGSAQLATGAVSTPQLANQAVTPEKISTSDAADGDVLMLVGDSLAWTQPPGAEGLVLPTARDLDSEGVPFPEAAFRVRHYGGEAIVGVAGAHNSQMLTGVRGEARAPFWMDPFSYLVPDVSHGVLGRASLGSVRIGVYGLATADGLGSYYFGEAIEEDFSQQGVGVFGEGASDGVIGIAAFGTGVSGTGTEYGVRGIVENPNSEISAGVGGFGDQYGVLGLPTAGFPPDFLGSPGYERLATSSAGIVGVRGSNLQDGIAGLFIGRVDIEGDLRVTGNIQKPGGSFRIDHPLDPANQWLYHSFVESPDMMNVYNGNAELDETGEAVVVLPDYFAALNSDFRYQLTAIGAPGPYLHIAEEIQDNQFRIAGGLAGSRVSWQVTGIRRDLWAEENRIEVETLKAPEERGRYYGQQ